MLYKYIYMRNPHAPEPFGSRIPRGRRLGMHVPVPMPNETAHRLQPWWARSSRLPRRRCRVGAAIPGAGCAPWPRRPCSALATLICSLLCILVAASLGRPMPLHLLSALVVWVCLPVGSWFFQGLNQHQSCQHGLCATAWSRIVDLVVDTI